MANNSGFSFNVKVRLNSTDKIIKDHGLDKNGRVVRYLRDTADRLMMPFIPGGAKGMMAKLKTYPNVHSIKYTSPQAHYQFTGKLMLQRRKNDLIKDVENFIKSGG